MSPNSNSRNKLSNKNGTYTETEPYMLPSVRGDNDKSSTKSSSRHETSLDDTLHTTPKKKFSSFKFNNSQTPQKREINPTGSEEDLDYGYGRQRRDQMSLDLSNNSRRFKVSPSPIMAFRLNSKETDTDAMSGDLRSQKSLKKMLSQTSKNFGTIKKSHMFTSNLLEKEPETNDEDSNKKSFKDSQMTLNTINSAMVMSSARFTKFDPHAIANVRSPVRASHLVNGSKFHSGKRDSHANQWGEGSATNQTMKTINSRSCTTIASVDATSRVFQIRSPLSEIRTSDILDLEYANTVRRIRLLGAGSEAKVYFLYYYISLN